MKRSDTTYPSADGCTPIHAICWEPDGPIRGVIQISHGISEHMGRYEELARRFTHLGFVVAGNDHLGHGLSQHPTDPRPQYFGPAGSWDWVLRDTLTWAERLKDRYPGVPHCLLGFSLGSFVVRCLLGDHPHLADLSIWGGTGRLSPVELVGARAVIALESRRFGDKEGTPLLRKLTMDAYNRQFRPCRTSSDWLCTNEEAIDQYLADPLYSEGFTVSSFRELIRGIAISNAPTHVQKMDPDRPVLILSGLEDPFGVGVEQVKGLLEAHRFRDVTLRRFPGMRHMIFHEKERELVFQEMEDWLEGRLKEISQ